MYDSAGEEEEEEEDRSSDGMATNSSELDFYLSGLSFIKRRRVPFPELGVDIVDGACNGAVLSSELNVNSDKKFTGYSYSVSCRCICTMKLTNLDPVSRVTP